MVVVYKIDRLTRSLADFAKLLDRLEAAECSFVSVTQAFNTSSSMGRLTLNVLLSFAQFEREVTAERIRDKIAASKKKGLWMGGLAPLGYDPHPDKTRRTLVINRLEAEMVRTLFQLYIRHDGLNATTRAAAELGLRSKVRHRKDGTHSGGKPLSRGQVHHILKNPVYRGRIRHKGKTWPGLHDAIIDDQLWTSVQDLLAINARNAKQLPSDRARSMYRGRQSAPLVGKLFDEVGDRLTPSHTKRGTTIHRYYVSNRLLSGTTDPTGWRVPARQIEQAVGRAIAAHFAERRQKIALGAGNDLAEVDTVMKCVAQLADDLRGTEYRSHLQLIERVDLNGASITMRLDANEIATRLNLPANKLDVAHLHIHQPLRIRRRGQEMKLVTNAVEAAPDDALVDGLRRAHRWAERLKSGEALGRIATSHKGSERYTSRIIALATLAPDIQHAILAGLQPADLTLSKLVKRDLPLDWQTQREMLGFTSPAPAN